MATAQKWIIHDEGAAQAPLSFQDVKRMLDQGKISPHTMICPEGSEDWKPASVHFAPPSPSTPRSPLIWLQFAVSALSLLAFIGFFLWVHRAHVTALVRIDKFQGELEKMQSTGRFVPFSDVPNHCLTDRTSASCTFTNVGKEPIFTCAAGSLQNKEVPELRVSSLVLCSGRLDPGTTRTVSSPWVGVFADDICSKETSSGRSLDWSQCTFTVDGVDSSGGKP